MTNYIEVYKKMIPQLDLTILKDQKERFENDIKHLKKPHPHQVVILRMLNTRIKKLEKSKT